MDLKGYVESYKRDGFVKIEGVFSQEEVAEIESAYLQFLRDEAPLLKGRDINYVDREKKIVNSIHKLHGKEGSFFDSLLKSERMRQLASAFLRAPAVGRGSEMFAKPASKGLKSPAHQDNFYWCLNPSDVHTALTVWVALDHCSAENGGVSYYKGSHRLGIIDHKNSYAPGSSQTISDVESLQAHEIVTPELKPGDVLIHDALTVHFSTDNTSGRSRRGMTLQYQSGDATIDPGMLNHYESQLKSQVSARENSI